MKSFAKKIALSWLSNPFRMRRQIERVARSRALIILSLHRVAPHDGSSYPPLDPAIFDHLLRFCKTTFEVVTFAELRSGRSFDRPPMIFSFDDGYKDFLQYAVPILSRHAIKVNQNIIPACVEGGLPPINVVVQDFIGKAPRRAVNDIQIPGWGFLDGAAEPEALGRRVSAFIKNKPIAEQKLLAEALIPTFFDVQEFKPTPMMSRDEIGQINGIHELGAHSYEHATMLCEDDDYVRDDASKCRQYFEETLGTTTKIYAFPNGQYRPAHLDIVRQEGFSEILLVGDQFSSPRAAEHHRFDFRATSGSEARFRASGGFACLPNR
jgi:peptidoglycan/xylan/chitin deacetylase (PgdA/CDA1 family)